MFKGLIAKILKSKGENKVENTVENNKVDNNPIVCGCFKITEKDIRNAVNNGAKTFEEVQAKTKVGTGCGRCIESNKKLVDKLIDEKKRSESPIVCGCFKITEQDIRDAVNNGAKTFEEVQAKTKVGTGCGRCIESNKKLVDKLILDKKINENAVVCGCFNVTVKDLATAIKNGAKTFEEVQTITKVGTGCGRCIESNKDLVAQLLAK